MGMPVVRRRPIAIMAVLCIRMTRTTIVLPVIAIAQPIPRQAMIAAQGKIAGVKCVPIVLGRRVAAGCSKATVLPIARRFARPTAPLSSTARMVSSAGPFGPRSAPRPRHGYTRPSNVSTVKPLSAPAGKGYFSDSAPDTVPPNIKKRSRTIARDLRVRNNLISFSSRLS